MSLISYLDLTQHFKNEFSDSLALFEIKHINFFIHIPLPLHINGEGIGKGTQAFLCLG